MSGVNAYLWTNKQTTGPYTKNRSHSRAYIFYKNSNGTLKAYVPNINLVNHPLGKYKARRNGNRPPVLSNENRKSHLHRAYTRLRLNPYHVYIMARNILAARRANQAAANRTRSLRGQNNAERQRAWNTHQYQINLWKNIKNLAKNMIGKTEAQINRTINNNIKRANLAIRPQRSQINALKNLIPKYAPSEHRFNVIYATPGQGRNFYVTRVNPNGTVNLRHELGIRNGYSTNAETNTKNNVKAFMKNRWNNNSVVPRNQHPRSVPANRSRNTNRGPRSAPPALRHPNRRPTDPW